MMQEVFEVIYFQSDYRDQRIAIIANIADEFRVISEGENPSFRSTTGYVRCQIQAKGDAIEYREVMAMDGMWEDFLLESTDPVENEALIARLDAFSKREQILPLLLTDTD